MLKRFFQLFVFFVLAVFTIGCSVTKGVEVRTYIEDRPRVDMAKQGNAGYLMGKPQMQAQSPIEPTRKMYVLEISKPAEGEGEAVEEASVEKPRSATSADTSWEPMRATRPQPRVNITPLDEMDVGMDKSQAKAVTFIDYKVEKDDTLQKIAKKFYDSYSKWPSIYEANKDKIQDPNRIKPGITLKVPME